MKYIIERIKISFLLTLSAILIFSSCNKDPLQIPGPLAITPPAGLALGETIASIPTDSLYYKIIVKAGLLATINNRSTFWTMFVPDNTAVRVFITAITGGAVPAAAPDAAFAAFIASASFPAANANGLVNYNLCPQIITTASIPSAFPNFQYPCNLNPAPSISALLRLTTFPSIRNGNWLNNVPLTAVNNSTVNGVIHHLAAVVTPPSRFLIDRVNSDADLTILKAALSRADSGVAPSASTSLIGALGNIGANLTVFAPSNQAFKNIIALLTGGAINNSQPDAVYIGFLGSNNISTQTVKGIVVYHIMGTRAFANNFPTTAASYPTLLNGAIPAHPGVSLKCIFTGLNVTAATSKGVVNATASNIAINPTPDPGGTSDQHFLNGTLHKIDQVMLPQ